MYLKSIQENGFSQLFYFLHNHTIKAARFRRQFLVDFSEIAHQQIKRWAVPAMKNLSLSGVIKRVLRVRLKCVQPYSSTSNP